MKNILNCAVVFLAATLGLTPGSAVAQKGGGKGKPKDPPPPILYEVTWLGSLGGQWSNAHDVKDGAVVGSAWDAELSFRGFVWTPELGIQQLDATPGLVWFDLDLDVSENPAQPGRLGRASSISDACRIAGTAVDAQGNWRAYLYDPTVNPPEVLLLPTMGAGNSGGGKLNNRGDIVYPVTLSDGKHVLVYTAEGLLIDEIVFVDERGVGAMNNLGQIVGKIGGPLAADVFASYRYTPNSPVEEFDDLWAGDINDFGNFVGHTIPFKERAFRYTDNLELLTRKQTSARATGINNSNDVCGHQISSGQRVGFVYTDEHGLLELDALATGSPEDLAKWFGASGTSPTAISDRDATGFGAICGDATFGGNECCTEEAFLLTPVLPD